MRAAFYLPNVSRAPVNARTPAMVASSKNKRKKEKRSQEKSE
jgi:hypothetical protein